ncbi:thermonuclease family protein, partial [Escherichia coli]
YEGGQGFRLYGIDTEEMKRKGVQADSQPEPSPGATGAQKYLENVMANEKVSFEEKGSDKYGRKIVRVIGENGRDINEELVRNAGAGLMSFNNETSPYAGARAD